MIVFINPLLIHALAILAFSFAISAFFSSIITASACSHSSFVLA